ncbi:hypothetical protein [Nostoc sp.]
MCPPTDKKLVIVTSGVAIARLNLLHLAESQSDTLCDRKTICNLIYTQ